MSIYYRIMEEAEARDLGGELKSLSLAVPLEDTEEDERTMIDSADDLSRDAHRGRAHALHYGAHQSAAPCSLEPRSIEERCASARARCKSALRSVRPSERS